MKRRDAPTFRQIHDALRKLWILAERPDPPVGQIRALLKKLPEEVKGGIEKRAERRWSVYFAEAPPPIFVPGWFAKLPGDQLLALLPGGISEGGLIVRGRGRGARRRSKPRYEPVIRGVARGAAPSSQIATLEGSDKTAEVDAVGGRPRDDTALELIWFLAMDWRLATGEPAVPGRGDKTPFGDLVHQVFGWLGLPDATGALRRRLSTMAGVSLGHAGVRSRRNMNSAW